MKQTPSLLNEIAGVTTLNNLVYAVAITSIKTAALENNFYQGNGNERRQPAKKEWQLNPIRPIITLL